jgi:drug/metabolite transporter (DMT)-like permease
MSVATEPNTTLNAGRFLGATLVIASAAVFGLAGVLTKSIAADPLTIACWRGLVGGVFITLYVVARAPAGRRLSGFRLGWRGLLLATIGAVASVAFIAAFKHTYVANVAIIYATVPFAAALLERLMLGERIRPRTAFAAGCSLAGVAVMAMAGLGAASLAGDGLAVVMMFLCALYMVLIRAFRDTPVVLAAAISGFELFVLGWLVADPMAVNRHDAFLLVAFGVSFALASILWTEGTRLVTAAESGLLGSAEVPFAILFGFVILSEVPPAASIFGGAIVLAAVFAHTWLDYRRAHRPAIAPATVP